MSYDITAETLPERLTLMKRAHLDADELGGWLSQAYQDLFAYIAERDVPVIGPPFARYAFNGGVGAEAGVPVAAPAARVTDAIGVDAALDEDRSLPDGAEQVAAQRGCSLGTITRR